VDFHDDLRGLLVDRRRGRAWAVGALAAGRAPVDAGNFLAHAVLEGRLREVEWVHDAIGGRAWDLGIVRYETDLFALHHRVRRALSREAGALLAFGEVLLDDWSGPRPERWLSVDWDCFASVLQDEGGIGGRVDRFLERLGGAAPPHTYVAYSPEYCHDTLDGFRAFLDRLSARLVQPVEWLDPGLREGRLHPTGVSGELPRGLVARTVLFLRRRGLF
jgi:hypothetical protein